MPACGLVCEAPPLPAMAPAPDLPPSGDAPAAPPAPVPDRPAAAPDAAASSDDAVFSVSPPSSSPAALTWREDPSVGPLYCCWILGLAVYAALALVSLGLAAGLGGGGGGGGGGLGFGGATGSRKGDTIFLGFSGDASRGRGGSRIAIRVLLLFSDSGARGIQLRYNAPLDFFWGLPRRGTLTLTRDAVHLCRTHA